MDGNGRWAEARGLPRILGHESGVESVRAVTRHAAALGLEQLTLYAFSTENWRRPAEEVDFLMGLLEHFLVSERGELMDNDVRLLSIGRIQGLPAAVRSALARSEALTRGNRGLRLCLALNYGGRLELAEAARRLAEDARAGRLDLDDLDGGRLEQALADRLYQPDMPPIDLMVRTAGESRLSNFLLWQMAYGEIWITDVCWPDFREEELESALAAFATRERRYGGLIKKVGS
jgi:undecaprenyl diphosphate synthase